MEPAPPFSVSARAYDIIYTHMLDYDAIVARVVDRLDGIAPAAQTVLEVGCGTGLWLERMVGRYESVVGVDISASMLAEARRRLPGVEFVRDDMRSFDLGRRFDVIVCMFSSIGYMETAQDLAAAYTAFARHLDTGGVALVEPWFRPDVWRTGDPVTAEVFRGAGGVVSRMSRSERDGNVSIMDMHHLAALGDEPVVHFVERHRMGLFTVEDHMKAFAAAGLRSDHDPEGPLGRGLYTAMHA